MDSEVTVVKVKQSKNIAREDAVVVLQWMDGWVRGKHAMCVD